MYAAVAGGRDLLGLGAAAQRRDVHRGVGLLVAHRRADRPGEIALTRTARRPRLPRAAALPLARSPAPRDLRLRPAPQRAPVPGDARADDARRAAAGRASLPRHVIEGPVSLIVN